MRLFVFAAALSLTTPVFSYSRTYSLSRNTTYDQKHESLRNVVCSTGEYGLLTHGYKTFKDIPTYPYIGGAPQIRGESSLYCSSCWELTYIDSWGAPTCVNFTAISASDHGSEGFSISSEGMNYLTHNQDEESIQITAIRKPREYCLPDWQ